MTRSNAPRPCCVPPDGSPSSRARGPCASQAGPELLALGQALAAPIGTSLGARGIIPTRHPLSIGCVGNYAAPPANQIVHEAELVLFVGCHTGDQVTHTWRIPAIDTQAVQIDIDPLELGRSYPGTRSG